MSLLFSFAFTLGLQAGEVEIPVLPANLERHQTANTFTDFVLNIATATGEANVMIEAFDLSPEPNDEAIALYLHEGSEVPLNARESVDKAESYTDRENRAVTLNINARAVTKGTWHLMLYAGATDVHYTLNISLVYADVSDFLPHAGHVCPDDWAYHSVLLGTGKMGSGKGSTQFVLEWHVMLLTGGPFLLAVKGDYYPLKLPANSRMVSESARRGVVTMCLDVPAGDWYVGVYGSDTCGTYTVRANLYENTTCTSDKDLISAEEEVVDKVLVFDTGNTDFSHSYSSAAGICQPHQYDDYRVNIDAELEKGNLIIELRSTTLLRNEEALTLSLFEDEIPPTRHTEQYVSSPNDGVYTLAISAQELRATDYYISVLCGGQASAYELLLHLIPSEATIGVEEHGEVCIDEWVYHVVSLNSSAMGMNLRVDVNKLKGDFYVMVRESVAPIKLLPPYLYLGAEDKTIIDYICNLFAPVDYYIAIIGGDKCSQYELTVTVVQDEEAKVQSTGECVDTTTSAAVDEDVIPLVVDRYQYSSCGPGSWIDFSLDVDEAMALQNAVFTVEVSGEQNNPQAISVHLFEGSISKNRDTELRTMYGYNRQYSLVVNALEVVETKYFVCVRCEQFAQRFRIFTTLVDNDISEGRPHSGEMCPGEWLYHAIDVTQAAALEMVTDSVQRRRASPIVDDGSSGTVDGTSTRGGRAGYWPADREGERRASLQRQHKRFTTTAAGYRRSLGTPRANWTSAAIDAAAAGRGFRFVVTKYVGDLYLLSRAGHPPLRLAVPFQLMSETETTTTIEFCEPWDAVANGYQLHLALTPDSACASYEVRAEAMPLSECLNATTTTEFVPTLSQRAQPIELRNLVEDSCTARAYKDYRLTVTEEYEEDNFIIELVDLGAGNNPQSLQLQLFFGEIASDRDSEIVSDFTLNKKYSISLNAHDVRAGDYFISVLCVSESVEFQLIVTEINTQLLLGHKQSGQVCVNNWVYHTYTTEQTALPVQEQYIRLRFSMTKITGAIQVMTRHDSPPVKLVPPYVPFNVDDTHLEVDVCDVLPGRTIYLGLNGDDGCAVYDVIVREVPNDKPCRPQVHNTDEDLPDHVKLLEFGYYSYADCAPSSWVDFQLLLTEDVLDSNLIFEVEDLGADFNPNAISIYLYESEVVPGNRHSEFQTTTSTGKLWTISLDQPTVQRDFAEGLITLGVQCGISPVSFRAIVHTVEAALDPDEWQTGSICKGDWAYHYYDTSILDREWGDHAHLKFMIEKYTGAITVYTDHMTPPLKEVPPFELMSTDQSYYEVSMCGLEEGLMYIGLQGKLGCASYKIGLVSYTDADVQNGAYASCAEMGNEGETADEYHTLALNAFERGSCSAYSWKDFEFTISSRQEREKDNLIFQVELLEREQPNINALSIHLYDEHIPFDRHTEEVARIPTNGLWTIPLSSLDVSGGTYFLGVHCGPLAQRFRVMVVEVQGALRSVADEVDGEVCPEEWVYATYRAHEPSKTTLPRLPTSHHRTLLPPTPLLRYHYINVSNDDTPYERRRRRRQLGMSYDAKAALGRGRALQGSELVGKNLMVHVKKFVGSLFFMAFEGLSAPRQLLPPYRVMKESDGSDSAAFCNVQPLPDLGWNMYWVAMVGGDECSVYEVTLLELPPDDPRCLNGAQGPVIVSDGDELSGEAQDLVIGQNTYGSCKQYEYADFRLPLWVSQHADANMLFELRLRDSVNNPEAVSFELYQGKIPSDRRTEIIESKSINDAYTILVNVVELNYQLCRTSNNADKEACISHLSPAEEAAWLAELANMSTPDPPKPVVTAENYDLVYHVSVRCGPLPQRFELLLYEINTALHSGRWQHGELCPGHIVYHSWSSPHTNRSTFTKVNVRFFFIKHKGNAFVMARSGFNIRAAPLKLDEPNFEMGLPLSRAHVDYCGVYSGETVYMAVFGDTDCMSYDLKATLIPDGEPCFSLAPDLASDDDTYASGAEEVSTSRFIYSSCAAHTWEDYRLDLGQDNADEKTNFIIEVTELKEFGGLNPTAISLHVFEGGIIPADRQTEHKDEQGLGGTWSVALNRHFDAGGRIVYFSVKCGFAPVRFRLVVHEVQVPLTLGQVTFGEVCEGIWLYHIVEVPLSDMPGHKVDIHIDIKKFSGIMDVFTRKGVVPAKRVPPFVNMVRSTTQRNTTVCAVDGSERVWVGMLGGEGCASYEIIATTAVSSAASEGSCNEEVSLIPAETSIGNLLHTETLQLGVCTPYAWSDWYIPVNIEDQLDNMIFELTDNAKSDGDNPEAVSVHLFHNFIPPDRRTETKIMRSKGGVYSMSISKTDFEPYLQHPTTRNFIFGIQCGPKAVSFTVFLRFVQAQLPLDGTELDGQVCPEAWMHHTIDVSRNLTNDMAVDEFLTAVGVDADHTNQRRRSLEETRKQRIASGEMPPYGGSHDFHLALEVTKFSGDMQIMLKFERAPLQLVPPYTVLEASQTSAIVPICDFPRYFTDASDTSQPPQFYVGVFGGASCASYKLRLRKFLGVCDEAEQQTELAYDVDAAVPLPVGSFLRGSCLPFARHAPFLVKVPVSDMVANNLAMEVHDLNDDDNPHSLSMVVYKGGGTHEMLTEVIARDSEAKDRVYSAGFDYITLANKFCTGVQTSSNGISSCLDVDIMGEISIVVACGEKAVSFQVIARLSPLELPQNARGLGVPLSSEVCPKQWAYHKEEATLMTATGDQIKHLRFEVDVNSGDIYYAMVRWHFPPGFSACNADEVILSGQNSGSITACNVGDVLDNHANVTATAYIGLFGGSSCAVYTVRSVPIIGDDAVCNATRMGLVTGCEGEKPLSAQELHHVYSGRSSNEEGA